jgi:hypothetical protein
LRPLSGPLVALARRNSGCGGPRLQRSIDGEQQLLERRIDGLRMRKVAGEL